MYIFNIYIAPLLFRAAIAMHRTYRIFSTQDDDDLPPRTVVPLRVSG